MRRSKIIVISQTPPPTHGSTVITRILLQVLSEDGQLVELVDRRFSRTVGEVGGASLRKVLAVPSLVSRLLFAAAGAPKVCVFFCTNRPLSFITDVLLSEILRLFRVPTINYIHTSGYTDLASRGPLWRWLVRRLLSNAVRTVCLAHSLTGDVREFARKGSVSVIPNTIEERDSVAGEKRTEDRTANEDGPILFLSNLLEEKGADVFVDMAIEICDQNEAPHFALVGQQADEELAQALQRKVELSGHSDRVTFLGPKFDSDKWDVLAQARMLVFPSRYRFEAQPLAVIEAFSMGIPVIAADVGAIGEMVGEENGVLLRMPSSAEAVEAVSRFLNDPAARARASRGARQTYLDKHSRHAFQQAWRKVIDACA